MSRVVRCRDAGFDCEGVVRAGVAEEAMRQVAEQARSVMRDE